MICDVARPPDVADEVRRRRDVIVPRWWTGRAPRSAAALWVGNLQGLPTGTQLACLSETILLSLAGQQADVGSAMRFRFPMPSTSQPWRRRTALPWPSLLRRASWRNPLRRASGMREDNQAAASPLQRAAQTLVARYHGQPKLVSDQAGWSRIIALLADDTSDGVRLQITSGQVVSIDPPDRPVTPPWWTSSSAGTGHAAAHPAAAAASQRALPLRRAHR